MPLTVKEGALLGAGMWTAAAATFFYKRKQTRAFKLAYFISWPLLGTAILWTAMPDRERMEQELQQRGLDPRAAAAGRQAVAVQMEQLRSIAAAGNGGRKSQQPDG